MMQTWGAQPLPPVTSLVPGRAQVVLEQAKAARIQVSSFRHCTCQSTPANTQGDLAGSESMLRSAIELQKKKGIGADPKFLEELGNRCSVRPMRVVSIYLGLGLTLTQAGRRSEAIAAYREALSDEPNRWPIQAAYPTVSAD